MDRARQAVGADEKHAENHLPQQRGAWRPRQEVVDEASADAPPRPAPHGPSRRSPLRFGWSLAGAAAVTLLAAACTSGGYSTTYGSGQTASSGPAAAPVVGLRASTLGQTLVDGQGNTLYLFEADTSGKSACTGACASIWPPYLSTGTPQAGTGVTAGKLSTISRSDGGMQVTYAGHPLYRYAGDAKPGDVTGQALDQYGAKWYVLGANGSKIDND